MNILLSAKNFLQNVANILILDYTVLCFVMAFLKESMEIDEKENSKGLKKKKNMNAQSPKKNERETQTAK